MDRCEFQLAAHDSGVYACMHACIKAWIDGWMCPLYYQHVWTVCMNGGLRCIISMYGLSALIGQRFLRYERRSPAPASHAPDLRDLGS